MVYPKVLFPPNISIKEAKKGTLDFSRHETWRVQNLDEPFAGGLAGL